MEHNGSEGRRREVDSLQRELTSVPDIRAARVVTDNEGRISEVHLVADGSRSSKQLVRDVQTLALARHGIRIDYRVISVVNFGAEPVPDDELTANLPSVASITWTTDRARTTCTVEVEARPGVGIGEASGAVTGSGRARLAARAAAQALSEAESLPEPVDVTDLAFVDLGGHRVATVMLLALAGHREEHLLGSAIAGGDDSEAAVRAVLDAFSRRTT